MKYNKKIVKRITDLISKDSYTIQEICSLSGICKDTYYEWLQNKPDFADSIEKAKKDFDDILANEAKKSLIKLVKGYEVEETKTVYTEGKEIDPATGRPKPKIKEKTTVKKHFQPNVAATIFLLTNKAADEYKNRQNNEVTGKDGKDLFAGKSDEELNARIAELEAKLKG